MIASSSATVLPHPVGALITMFLSGNLDIVENKRKTNARQILPVKKQSSKNSFWMELNASKSWNTGLYLAARKCEMYSNLMIELMI